MRLWATLALIVACSAPSKPTTHGSATKPPRLVVLFIIDQWPQWAFVQKRPHMTHGFERMLREGEWHTGEHPGAATLTAPGHALLGSGEPTATSGILANEWWHRDVGRVLKSVEAADGTIGPHNLRVPGLGDAIAAANRGGKAVGVSLKDRAAILPLGKAGLAVFYDRKAGQMTTNAATAPAWLGDLATAHPIKSRLEEAWMPLDPAKLAALSGTTDDQKGEIGEKNFGPTFPHAPRQTKDWIDALFAIPLGNEVVMETALAAIDGEHLGADDVPDLLVLSLSAHDYVGHGWGHESWESWDMTLRLDDQLERFLAGLDAKVGSDGWAMIMTSDHGAAPLPERSHGGRLAFETIRDVANGAAMAQLGPGDWIANAEYPNIYLTDEALQTPAHDKVLDDIIRSLRELPGIDFAARTADYVGGCDQRTGDAFKLCLSLDRERSGEVFYLPAYNWILEERDEPLATAHGSLHDYDRQVPVIIRDPGAAPHTAQTAPSRSTIYMVRIATLLARWLGVTPPSTLARQQSKSP